jgi:ABC-2 type transport system permease protein
MRAFGAMLSTSIKMFIRNRGAVFFGVAFPLILMGLIGAAFGGAGSINFSVSFVDEGNPQVARALLAGLRQVPVFHLVEEDRPAALAALREGDRSLVVIVPAGHTALEAFFDSSREQTSRAALMIFERFVAEANLRLSGTPPLLTVTSTPIAGERVKFFDFLLPGILAMTIAQTGLLGVAPLIAELRERRVLKRVMATPVPPLAFLGGLLGRSTLIQLLQGTVILLVATLIFGARVHGSLWQLAVLALLGALTFFGLGFAISTLSRTSDTANLFGSVVFFPMMFLAGTFWPRELMPEAIRPIIAYLPLSPLVDAMRGVSAYGEPVTNYMWAIAYMAAATVVAFAVASRRFRWE